jgi:hypothetical protein
LKLGYLIVAASMLTVTAFAAVQSGLKPGVTPGAFDVVDVSGPNKGKQLCYRCSYGASPVLAAFVNGDPSKASGLVSHIQKLAESRKEKGLRTFVVFMGGPELKPAIEKLAADGKVTIPMTFLPRGTSEEDIAAYKINSAADNTVLLWRGSVRSNFVNVGPDAFPSIDKAVDQMLQ